MMKILHENVFKSLDFVGFQCPRIAERNIALKKDVIGMIHKKAMNP